MKLVELLAKELAEWPEEAEYADQDQDREVRFSGSIRSDFFASVLAEHCPENACPDGIPYSMRVTREMWEDERNKAEAYVSIDEDKGYLFDEISSGLPGSQQRYNHKCTVPTHDLANDRFDDPRHSRDRIREIDKQLSDLAIERAELVSKLAGEGFALIAAVAEPSEDMTDWRNWKVGDFVECVREIRSTTGISVGSIYALTCTSGDSIEFDDDDDCRDRGDPENFKFHSRPSA